VPRPHILCISLSNVHVDARVLRQLSVLADFGEVTTIGFGPKPAGATHHIEVPAHLKTLPQTPRGVFNLALRRMRASELAAPAVSYSLRKLEGMRFDLVVANEARVLALADRVAHGSPIWADMHEWAPEERTNILSWRLLVAPLMQYLCEAYLSRSAAVSTVCESIADLYESNFGVSARVIRNSGPFADLSPSPVSDSTIRLVHSGAAMGGRNLELMIDAVAGMDSRFSLDFYLVTGGEGSAYLESLRTRASNCDRITFHDPVKPHELPATLNAYDVGVHWIPPTTTNARLALPNKFFDYVQARLALAIGPSIEMERLVKKFELGTVSTDFTIEKCQESLASLSVEDIRKFKANSNASAQELSFATDREVTASLVRALLPQA
jgi:hypothetical protein